MEVSIFEVLFFLTLLVYTAPHIMVFGAVYISVMVCNSCMFCMYHISDSLCLDIDCLRIDYGDQRLF